MMNALTAQNLTNIDSPYNDAFVRFQTLCELAIIKAATAGRRKTNLKLPTLSSAKLRERVIGDLLDDLRANGFSALYYENENRLTLSW